MKFTGRILLVIAFAGILSFSPAIMGCGDSGPKNVDSDKKEDELEMPEINDGEDEEQGESGEASLSGPSN